MESIMAGLNLSPIDVSQSLQHIHQERQLINDDDYIKVALAILTAGLVIAITGIFTNILNIRTFIKMGIEDGVTSLFLTISCSDLAFVILASSRNIWSMIYLIEKATAQWQFVIDPLMISIFSDNSGYVMYITTSLISTFLAVVRCMCVVKPLHFKHMFTRGRCLIACVVCFLFPVACQTAVFANMGSVDKFNYGQNSSRPTLWMSSDRERVKDLVRLILGFLIPILTQVIAVICITLMVIKLREAARFRTSRALGDKEDKDAASAKLTGKDLQVVRQVVLIIFIYLILNIQKIVESVLTAFDDRLDHGKAHRNMHDVLSHLVSQIDSALE